MAVDEVVVNVNAPDVADTVDVTIEQVAGLGDVLNVTISDQDTIAVKSVQERGETGPKGRVGDPGPKGDAGPQGDAVIPAYVHHQDTPSAEWVITHDLGFQPNITVVDSAGTRMDGGDVHYLSADTVVVQFGSEFGGLAYLS